MIFCRCCGKEIHETASACPHCGGQQQKALVPQSRATDGSLWIPISSMVLGILCALTLFDDSEWDRDTLVGVISFALASLVLGIVSIANQKTGKSMAVAGVVLSAITIFCLF